MTSPLDRPLGRAAHTLINRFGKLATLERETVTVTPATGAVAKSVTALPVKVIVEAFSAHLVDETNIRSSDVRITLAGSGNTALTFTPSPAQRITDTVTATDYVRIGTTRYQVHRLLPVYSGELVAIYGIHGRR